MSTPSSIIDGVLITSTSALYYTVPDYNSLVIKHFVIHNTGSTPVSITINLVNDGDTVTAKNQIFKRKIAPLEDKPVLSVIGATLNPKTKIYLIADVTNVVSCRAGGNLV